jgi:hypothetical protein
LSRILQVLLASLVERGERVHVTVEERDEARVVRAGKHEVLEERLGVLVPDESLLDEHDHRVDVARRAGGIHERDRLATEVFERLEPGLLSHVNPRGVRRVPVPLVLRDDHRLRLAIREDVPGRVDEREVRSAVPQRLHDRGVVRGHGHAYRDADELAERRPEGLAGHHELRRLLRRREDQVQPALSRRRPDREHDYNDGKGEQTGHEDTRREETTPQHLDPPCAGITQVRFRRSAARAALSAQGSELPRSPGRGV